jgi:uncharacterized membrane protein
MILALFAMVTLLAFTALAVDIGLGASRTRDLQQVADIIALDITRLLGTEPETSATLRAAVDDQVAETSSRNDFPVTGSYPSYASGTRSVEVDLGCWTQPPLDGSVPGVFTTTCPQPNAVRVLAEDTVDYKFADVIGVADDVFDREATAARIPKTYLGIGTVGVGLQQSLDPVNAAIDIDATVQALNARLRAAFGVDSTVNPPPNGAGLDVLAYRGLAASDVAVGDLAAAAGFASPAELADATITNGQFFEATAQALEADGNTAAANHIRAFASQSDFDADNTMRLGDGPLAFEQGTGTVDDPRAAEGRINVMDLLVGSATIANGRNFVNYTLNPAIPNVTAVSVEQYVVEGVQWRYGSVGTSVSSAQIRTQVRVELAPGFIPGLTSPVTLPFVIEGATGTATLTGIRCYEPDTLGEADVAAATNLARVRLGVANNLNAAAGATITYQQAVVLQAGPLSLDTLLFLGLNPLLGLTGNVTADSSVDVGGGTSTHLFFPNADPNPPQRSMGGLVGGNAVASALASGLTITGVPVLGQTNLLGSFGTLFNGLGSGLIDPLLHAAGITVGGADVFANDMDCETPELVG